MRREIDPEYLTVKQLATYSGLAERTIRGFLKQPTNPLPHYRLGHKLLRVSRTDFQSWISRYRIDSDDQLSHVINDIVKSVGK